MTTQKSFKRRVRARMAETGESYTAARRQLVPEESANTAAGTGEVPGPSFEVAEEFTPEQRALFMLSEKAVESGTGHGWRHWVTVLDDWGATAHSHAQIARWLVVEHEISGWWAQGVAVSYERLRGMRAVGEGSDGFAASASKTIAVSADRLFDAFEDEELRDRWLPGVVLRVRTATRPKSARFDVEGELAGTLLTVAITAKAPDRSGVAIQHLRLADAERVRERKEFWRTRLAVLKSLLEDG